MKDCVYKTCHKCNETKEIGHFFYRKNNNRYRKECKVCFNHKDNRENYLKRKRDRELLLKETMDMLGLGLRKCSECNKVTTLDKFRPDFHHESKLYAVCYDCINVWRRDDYRNNPSYYQEANLRWRLQNPEKFKETRDKVELKRKPKRKEYSKAKYAANPAPTREKVKAWRLANLDKKRQIDKKYRNTNRKKVAKRYAAWHKNKLKTDLNYRIGHKLRTSLRGVLKRCGGTKFCKTAEYFGCSLKFLKFYIESLFLPGMSWDNYGPGYLIKDGKPVYNNRGETIKLKHWCIDHVIPCASFDFTDIEQQKKCFHYSNLRPLWTEDNLGKSDFMSDGSRARNQM